jgi:hypothetical protein
MTDLANMTQVIWDKLAPAQREAMRDLGGLTPQLIGLEGWLVEAIRTNGEACRFIVSRSTGWRPCHIELATTSARGGMSADSKYRSINQIRKVR